MTLAVVVATEMATGDGDSIVAVPTAALKRYGEPVTTAPDPMAAPPAAAATTVAVAEPRTAVGAVEEGPTVLDRLLEQLEALGVTEHRVITRPESAPALREHGHQVVESGDLAGDLAVIAQLAGQAHRARRPVLLIHADVVSHTELLARVVLGNKAAATAVIARGRPYGAPTRPLVRVDNSRVVSAGSPYHQVTDPNGVFLGVLWVSAAETGRLAVLATELGDLLRSPDGPATVEPIRYLRHAARSGPRPERAAPEPEPLDPAYAGALELLRVTPVTGADAPGLLLVGLVRSGVTVTTRRALRLRCERVLTQAEADGAQRAWAMVDEDAERLAAAVKSDDGFFTTFAVSTYSRYIARWAARRGLTPNMVTSFSMALAVVAAVGFAVGSRPGMVFGAVLLYLAFVFDCVDGQLARYSRRFSTLGAWLDATFDRAKEYVVFAGLAVGSTAAAVSSSVHAGDVWGLAVAAMVVQTTRHMVDFSFGTARRRASRAAPPVLPLTDADDGLLDDPGGEGGESGESEGGEGGATAPATGERRHGALGLVARLWAYTDRVRGAHWAKKIIVLPIGERFALISLTAALGNARITFVALLSWGAVAFAYTFTGRLLRSLAARPVSSAASDEHGDRLIAYRDDGPLARLLGRAAGGRVPPLPATVAAGALTAALLLVGHGDTTLLLLATLPALVLCAPASAHGHGGRFDWVVPPIMRAVEYAFLAVVGFHAGVSAPLVFTLIGVLAYHHYDTVYRTRQRLWPQRWVFDAGLGWEGRMIVAAVAMAAGGAAFAYAGLAVYLGLLFGVESVYTWVTAGSGPGVEIDLEAEGDGS